jgi:hypothetical protein
MKVTISYFRRALNADGETLQIAGGRTGGETITADGDSEPAPDETRLMRIASDTAILYSTDGGDTVDLLPANAFDYAACAEGAVVTIATA